MSVERMTWRLILRANSRDIYTEICSQVPSLSPLGVVGYGLEKAGCICITRMYFPIEGTLPCGKVPTNQHVDHVLSGYQYFVEPKLVTLKMFVAVLLPARTLHCALQPDEKLKIYVPQLVKDLRGTIPST
jgi:hypothetical protein